MDVAEDLLDEAPCGILSVRDDGTVIFANATLCRLLGFESLAGRNINDVLPPAARIFYQTHVYPLLRVHGAADEVYLSLRAQDGEPVPTLINGQRRLRDGEPVVDFSVVVTKRRNQFESELLQARRSAEEAIKARSRFLSILSHDLRAPLAAINMAADMLAAGEGGPTTASQRADLQRISSSSGYVLNLVTDLLNFARVDANRMVMRVAPIQISIAVERAAGIANPLARAAQLDLYVDDLADGGAVLADPDRLQQVLLNLLTNAIKFTNPHGQVTLRAFRDESAVRFDVIDTGRGIPAEELATVFDPFVQLDAGEPTGATAGVGLGLAISRSIAHEMSGELTVESTLGKGSAFSVTLPAA